MIAVPPSRIASSATTSLGCLLALPLLLGCGKKDDSVTLAPSATALASSQASPSSRAWHFMIDESGTTHVDMPGLSRAVR